MAIRDTLQIGDPKLKAKNKRITNVKSPVIIQLVQDLTDTMRHAGLIGIAAPQIGENYQIFVTEPRKTKTRTGDQVDQLRVYINPKIIWQSKKQIEIYEGCGSVLNGQLFGPVIRPQTITIQALDQEGNQYQLKADGLLGRVIQHEQDHLIGVEFTEKISDDTKLLTADHYITQILSNPKYSSTSKITVKKVKAI